MNIFNNDSEVLQIGALTIENQTECVVISGDVQIGKDQIGKEQAHALYEFAKSLCARFDEIDGLPAQLDIAPTASRVVANPFE